MTASKFSLFQSTSTLTTLAREKELDQISNIDEVLEKYPPLPALGDHLNRLLAEKNMTIADVNKEAQLDRKYIYQIFDGRKNASRDKLIAIAYGLHLSADETQTLLKISGNEPLYAKERRDTIILWALKHGKNMRETNELLYEHDCKTLGSLE